MARRSRAGFDKGRLNRLLAQAAHARGLALIDEAASYTQALTGFLQDAQLLCGLVTSMTGYHVKLRGVGSYRIGYSSRSGRPSLKIRPASNISRSIIAGDIESSPSGQLDEGTLWRLFDKYQIKTGTLPVMEVVE